jgi:hypothetical protein
MRNMLLAAGLLISMCVLGTTPSLADVDVDVGVGVGIPGIYVDPDYDDDYRHRRRGRLSCGEAKELVRDRGYRRVVTLDCGGRIYTFRATRGGNRYVLNVNPRTRAVWRR